MGAGAESASASVALGHVALFIAGQTLAVVSTLGPEGEPQAAVVGVAVSDRIELIFDSVDTSRKVRNLRRDPRVAMVIGGTMQDERSVQVDGVADEPGGAEGNRIRAAYFARWPDGRERLAWAGITHVRVIPLWVRWSDYTVVPPVIIEWSLQSDGSLQRK